jgi:NAD(P)-dependent dehydrogenase (short-subunit alcohol dehydrogenase family)
MTLRLEKPLHEFSSSEWDDVIDTNLRGVFLAMKYEIPYMQAGRGGNIVITASTNAIASSIKRSAYSSSKRGLVGLVQSAALDYAQDGIRVNALLPGTTATALVRRVAGMEKVPDGVWKLCRSQTRARLVASARCSSRLVPIGPQPAARGQKRDHDPLRLLALVKAHASARQLLDPEAAFRRQQPRQRPAFASAQLALFAHVHEHRAEAELFTARRPEFDSRLRRAHPLVTGFSDQAEEGTCLLSREPRPSRI